MMEPSPKLSIEPGMHVVVVGLGKSGFSAVKFLRQLGARISVSEGGRADRLDGGMLGWLQEKGVNLETGGHTSDLFCSADLLLVSPGVPLTLPALEAARHRSIPVVGELALAAGYLKTPVVAVTGTNGKSTVTTLIGDLLRAAGKEVFVGGNLGTPLTEYLRTRQKASLVVLEVSSFQLDAGAGFRPDIGLLLNVSPDHLDRYPDYQAYVDSKFSLFGSQLAHDFALLNGDDPEIARRLRQGGAGLAGRRLLFHGERRQESSGWLEGRDAVIAGATPETVLERYELAGTRCSEPPNLLNGLAAILAARLAGCPAEAIRRGLADFQLLPHRLAQVGEVDGVVFLDDSKATNIGAVASALAGMSRPVVLIAGGRDKGGDYQLLAEIVRQKVKAMVLIGEAREKMAQAWAPIVPIEMAETMEQAVQQSFGLAAPGEAVLLSPACASFDMFSGYVERGRVFRQAVAALQAEPSRRQKRQQASVI